MAQMADTSRFEIEVLSHDWSQPNVAARVCQDHAYLDFCLTSRPGPARGSYVDRWGRRRVEAIGSILFIPPGMTFYGACGAGKQQSLICLMDDHYFEGNLENISDLALLECLDIKNTDISYGLRRLAKEVADPCFISPVLTEALLVTLSVDLVRHLSQVRAADSRETGLAPWRMRRIEERIRSLQPLPSVGELADLCRMSTRHLARAFRNETGATLGQRIKAAGVARAQELLADERFSIKQIAVKLGFSNTSSFSSAFLRATGERPKEARTRFNISSASEQQNATLASSNQPRLVKIA